MSLEQQLDAERRRRLANEAVRLAYEDVVNTLGSNGFPLNIMAEDSRFPDFILPDTEGHLVWLSGLLAQGPVIVQFFRGAWCPYCRLMLDALVAVLPGIEACGATLLALTPDIGPWARDATSNHRAALHVLSDVDYGVGLAAGVVFRIPARYRARLLDAEFDFAERHGTMPAFLPIPAAFVLDRDGRVAWRFANIDFTRRADPGHILTAVRRLVAPGPE